MNAIQIAVFFISIGIIIMEFSFKKTLAASIALLTLSGCTFEHKPEPKSTLSMQQVQAANYGAYPSDYKQYIHQYLEHSLYDYDSAKIKFTTRPAKILIIDNDTGVLPWSALTPSYTGKIVEGPFQGDLWEAWAGYVVCADVNAKNLSGGYTGWQGKEFLFQPDGLTMINGNSTGYYCHQAEKSKEIYINDFSNYVTITP